MIAVTKYFIIMSSNNMTWDKGKLLTLFTKLFSDLRNKQALQIYW